MGKKHRCTPDRCWKVIKGKLVNVCRFCPEAIIENVLGYAPSKGYRLGSAETRHRQYPKTFEIPPAHIRNNAEKGDMVKLLFIGGPSPSGRPGAERMWLCVQSRMGTGRKTRYVGILQSKPLGMPLNQGAKVEFGPQHIASAAYPISAIHGYTPRKKYPKMTAAQKACASEFIGDETVEYNKGRWDSRQQAIAVGLSRARREC